MTGSTAAPDQPYHFRSTSIPSRPHPLAVRVEEELHKLRTCVVSSTTSITVQMIIDGLRALGDLYDCIGELLRSPRSQQALSHPHQIKWMEEELEESVRLLDLCGALRDTFAAAKHHTQDLQCALRRKGDMATVNKLHAYLRSQKKALQDIKNRFRSLKQMDNKCGSYPNLDKDFDPSVVMVLMGAREVTIALLRSIFSFSSMPRPKPKASRWAFISKALHMRKVACEGEHEDATDVGSLNSSLCACYECISCIDVDDGRVLKVQDQLKALEVSTEGVESGLECLFKQLIRHRVSVLNIHSL